MARMRSLISTLLTKTTASFIKGHQLTPRWSSQACQAACRSSLEPLQVRRVCHIVTSSACFRNSFITWTLLVPVTCLESAERKHCQQMLKVEQRAQAKWQPHRPSKSDHSKTSKCVSTHHNVTEIHFHSELSGQKTHRLSDNLTF